MAEPNITTLYNWLIGNEVGLSTEEVDARKIEWEKGSGTIDATYRVTAGGITPSYTTGTEFLAFDWKWYENCNPS